MTPQAYSNVASALEALTECIITSHINPDGDAVGSALGLYHLLQQRGIKATVLLPSQPPANLMWLPGADTIKVWPAATVQQGVPVVVLDLNTLSRLEGLGEVIAAKASSIINIDHHMMPEDFATTAVIDTDASSTCQMVAHIATMAQWTVSQDAATCLYTGIMTDSGNFRFPRTTAELHHSVANLLEHGADPVSIFENVFNQSTLARQRMLGAALSSLRLEHHDKVCLMVIRAVDMQRFGATPEDVDGYVSYTLSIAGTRMGIMFVEFHDQIKCSFRSKGDTYVRDLAASFGGGGHQYAAGARLKGVSLDDAVHQVLTRVGEYLVQQPKTT